MDYGYDEYIERISDTQFLAKKYPILYHLLFGQYQDKNGNIFKRIANYLSNSKELKDNKNSPLFYIYAKNSKERENQIYDIHLGNSEKIIIIKKLLASMTLTIIQKENIENFESSLTGKAVLKEAEQTINELNFILEKINYYPKLKINTVTEYWYQRPITYDNKKYIIESTAEYLRILDRKNNTIILEVTYPVIVKQVSDNEFITVDKSPKEKDYMFVFRHIQYDKESMTSEIIYEKEYKSKSAVGKIRLVDDIAIMESYLETSLYNYKTRKSLTLESSTILKDENEEKPELQFPYLKYPYLIGRVNIEEKDLLTMYIDKETLEFDGVYSRVQDRIIPVNQDNSHQFEENYKDTIKKEVIKYLKLLEEIKKYYEEKSDKKATQQLTTNYIKTRTKKQQ